MMRSFLGAALATLLISGSLGAQAAPGDSTSIPDKQLFHRSDLYVAGGFVAGTIALFRWTVISRQCFGMRT